MSTLVIFLSGYILLLITVGYYLPFLKQKFVARTLAWIIACITVWFSSFITTDQPALLRMVVIVFLQLLSMKVLVVVETFSGENRLKVFQWLAFALGWHAGHPLRTTTRCCSTLRQAHDKGSDSNRTRACTIIPLDDGGTFSYSRYILYSATPIADRNQHDPAFRHSQPIDGGLACDRCRCTRAFPVTL